MRRRRKRSRRPQPPGLFGIPSTEEILRGINLQEQMKRTYRTLNMVARIITPCIPYIEKAVKIKLRAGAPEGDK